MKYIIWPANEDGKRAMQELGAKRTAFFADKKQYGKKWCSKDVISYDEMLEKARLGLEYVIVIASDFYRYEMEWDLKDSGIKNYFAFSQDDINSMKRILPFYLVYGKTKTVSYTEYLAIRRIDRYQRIVIYGVNRILPYLICEVMIQNPKAEIVIARQSIPRWECNTLGCRLEEFDVDSDEYDCMILNVRHNQDDIRNTMMNKSLSYEVIDIYDAEDYEPVFRYPELGRFRNIHKGKRGFVVATGPSLRIEDLNKLHEHGEICISVNKVYRAYDQTPWRADYLGLADPNALDCMISELPDIPGEIFVGDSIFHVDTREKISGVNYFHFKEHGFLPHRPRFTDDFTKGTYWSGTITYDFGLQFAAYLGFSEIYIIGADNDFSKPVADKSNHFISNYYDGAEKNIAYVPYHEKEINLAYEQAEIYSRSHGFRIFNATRGGKLEAFERVDFDELFKEHCYE